MAQLTLEMPSDRICRGLLFIGLLALDTWAQQAPQPGTNGAGTGDVQSVPEVVPRTGYGGLADMTGIPVTYGAITIYSTDGKLIVSISS